MSEKMYRKISLRLAGRRVSKHAKSLLVSCDLRGIDAKGGAPGTSGPNLVDLPLSEFVCTAEAYFTRLFEFLNFVSPDISLL